MRKEENANLQALLKDFKRGKRVPNGFKAVFESGVSKESIYGNHKETIGRLVETIKVYDCPEYAIMKEEEHIFSIVSFNGTIIVMGDSNNSENMDSWEQAFNTGLEYYKNGW